MENMMINHWAVVVAAFSDFFVGALWYSPLMFYKAWLSANNLKEEDLMGRHPGIVYGLTFIFSLIISYNLAFFLGSPEIRVMEAIQYSLLAGVGWSAMAFTIIALFENKSVKYILINCGYITVAFALKGLILGAWR